MKRIVTLVVSAVMASVLCFAQETVTSESWSGKINIGERHLNICFVFKTGFDGTRTCTMDVPDQGAKGVPVEILKYDTDSLNIGVTMLGATYKGRRVSSEAVEGIFTQNGISLPLNLRAEELASDRYQTPVGPFAYKVKDVIFENKTEGAQLSGTLTYPVNYENYRGNTVPVVLMVTGSGGQDRDEQVFNHKPFLVIADFLAKNGIASLRYDDRGIGKSTGPTEGMTTENFLADAEAGVSYLRNLKEFGKVGVLGHSEGGTIAFMMGANQRVDFLVSLAGSAIAGIDVLVGQNAAVMLQQGMSQDLVSDYTAALRIIYNDRIQGVHITDKAGYVEKLCKTNDFVLPAQFKANLAECITFGGEWMNYFLAYNPADAIGRITCPVMALNGNLDLQVLSKDNLPVLKERLPRNKKSLIKEYDALNHFFQHCTLATALNYGSIEETIAEEVLNDISHWIHTVK